MELFMRSALAIANMSQRLRSNPSARVTVKRAGQQQEETQTDEGGAAFLEGLQQEFNS
jgi:hypothetical protein